MSINGSNRPIADISDFGEKLRMGSFFTSASKALLFVVALPFAIAASLFGSAKVRSAEEVRDYLRNFLDGQGGDWDWDDFTSVPIADPSLESIRRRALDIDLPMTERGLTTLHELLGEAERLIAA